jgi:hypothetical protein
MPTFEREACFLNKLIHIVVVFEKLKFITNCAEISEIFCILISLNMFHGMMSHLGLLISEIYFLIIKVTNFYDQISVEYFIEDYKLF